MGVARHLGLCRGKVGGWCCLLREEAWTREGQMKKEPHLLRRRREGKNGANSCVGGKAGMFKFPREGGRCLLGIRDQRLSRKVGKTWKYRFK